MDPRVAASADIEAELKDLREQLESAQLSQVAHRRRAIVLLEGLEGSGKKFALKQIVSAFDPCSTKVTCVMRDRREAADGHWLARFWRQLPAAGRTEIFFRSWYRRVIDDRLLGIIDGKALARSFDEINEFEAQQRDYGTLIVKLYFDIPAEIQAQRLAIRAASPWHFSRDDAPLRSDHPGYVQALEDLRDNSDTRWSPWTIIDGTNEAKAGAEALRAVLGAYRDAVPSEPPHLVKSGSAA